jgi:hypothetical protein
MLKMYVENACGNSALSHARQSLRLAGLTSFVKGRLLSTKSRTVRRESSKLEIVETDREERRLRDFI